MARRRASTASRSASATSRRCASSRSRSPTASSWCSSGRRARGKTTALRMLAGLEAITAGEIRIGDRDVINRVAPRERDIAMVFQDYALYPQMTVLRQPRVRRCGGARCRRTRSSARVRRGGGVARARAAARAQAAPALRRPAAARRARPRAGARPAGVPDGRAALEPRRQAARADARRDQAAAAGGRHDDRLRHPRPGRGDDDGRPHRGHERRPCSSRSARRRSSTSGPANTLRGRLHRLARDELRARAERLGLEPDGRGSSACARSSRGSGATGWSGRSRARSSTSRRSGARRSSASTGSSSRSRAAPRRRSARRCATAWCATACGASIPDRRGAGSVGSRGRAPRRTRCRHPRLPRHDLRRARVAARPRRGALRRRAGALAGRRRDHRGGGGPARARHRAGGAGRRRPRRRVRPARDRARRRGGRGLPHQAHAGDRDHADR